MCCVWGQVSVVVEQARALKEAREAAAEAERQRRLAAAEAARREVE